MGMAKKNKLSTKLPALKRSVKDFLADEDGFVSKETILKIGLATVAGIGILGAMSTDASAGHTNHDSHNNNTTNSGATAQCVNISHTNAAGHSNHTSY
jgi:hypothetical protein